MTCQSRLPRRRNDFCKNGCPKWLWVSWTWKGFGRSQAMGSNHLTLQDDRKSRLFAQTACGSATALFGFEPMDAQDSARAANSQVVFIRSERSVSRSVPARGRGRRFGYEWVSFHRRILERRLSRVRARSASTGSMERTDEPVAGW